MRVAIVGCGKIADAHVEEIRKVPGAQLVAVCDLEPLMAEQLAVRYSIPHWYGTVSEMLKAQVPDVLHITTPPQSHLSLVRQAFQARCDVFLEKPVALHHADVQAILQAAMDADRKLTVNYWPNFEPQALELRRMHESGILGAPVHIESFYGYNLAGEYGTAIRQDPNHWVRKMPGMLFQNVLDHVLNKITPFLDDEEPLIHAHASLGGDMEATGPDKLLDELRVLIQGRHVSAYATFSAHARPVGHTLRVYGTKNTAQVDFNARSIALERTQTFPSALGRLLPPFKVASDYIRQGLHNVHLFSQARFHYFDGMRRLLTEFYGCIQNDAPPPISYDEILRVSAMMNSVIAQVYPEVPA